jgi:hypothetical protein
VRRLLMSGSPVQGRYTASEVNDGTCPEKPVHLRVHVTLTEAKGNSLSFLLRCEPSSGLGRVVIDGQSESHGVTLIELSANQGKPIFIWQSI